ncbi:MAG: glycosyltransferase family 39 protein [Acidobacteria bacterium]|nr:glycosyltransferase family 39 protein [Acidobacteriota bacterium]
MSPEPQPLPRPGAAREAFCWSALALFTLFLLVVNHYYYLKNTRVPIQDEAWYLETSLHLYHGLADRDLDRFVYHYKTAFQTKAPLISVLPLPFYLLFGPSRWSALQVNGLFLVVSNLWLFLLARRLFSAEVGLAAVVYYQTMPLAFGLSRTLMVEYGLAALVLVWLYCLVASDGLSRGVANFMLGVVLGLGLLMKVIFPVFIAGPFLVVWLTRRRHGAVPRAESPFWRSCARWPLAAIALPALAIAGSWYAFNLIHVLQFAWENTFGQIASGYVAPGQSSRLLLVINEGISSYYTTVVAVLGFAALAAAVRRLGWKKLVSNERALLLLGWLVPPMLVMAASTNREIRFAIPLLPVIAIFFAVSIFHLGRRRGWQAILALLIVIFPLRLFAELSFPARAHSHDNTIQWGPFLIFRHVMAWAHPPDSQGAWDQQRIVEAIHRMDTPEAESHYVVVGVEHPYFNANLLNYLDAYRRSNLHFTSLGYAESSADRAIERINKLDARFLVMAEGFHNFELSDFLNQINGGIQHRLDQGQLPFRFRARIPLDGGIQAVIYQREAP